MDYKEIIPDKGISLFVRSILIYEETESDGLKTVLPFYADGYPGIIFHETESGLFVNPHEKQMPLFFLYGQTITPIELVMQGNYRLVIIQLYPFVLQKFFDVEPKSINDNCYDLFQLQKPQIGETLLQLQSEADTGNRIQILSHFLYSFFQEKKQMLDLTIREALQLIIDHNGQLSIGDLCTAVDLNERTLERRFLNEVGITAKQFSKMIQFQLSMEQLTEKEYDKLTDIVYENGFSDQSHFIKVFKAFTGKTPKAFIKKQSL